MKTSMTYKEQVVYLALHKKMNHPKFMKKLEHAFKKAYPTMAEKDVKHKLSRLLNLNTKCFCHFSKQSCEGTAIFSHITSKSQLRKIGTPMLYKNSFFREYPQHVKSQTALLFCQDCDQLFGNYTTEEGRSSIDSLDEHAIDNVETHQRLLYRTIAYQMKKEQIYAILDDVETTAETNIAYHQIKKIINERLHCEMIKIKKKFELNATIPFVGTAILSYSPLVWVTASITEDDMTKKWHICICTEKMENLHNVSLKEIANSDTIQFSTLSLMDHTKVA